MDFETTKMIIQIPYKCKKYTPNDNLNKTCDNKTRCKIYYDEVCREYKEKEDEKERYTKSELYLKAMKYEKKD